jgi:hypothetical protein
MKSAVILAVCVGLISCALFHQAVESPFDQQLMPKLSLNLPFSQAPRANQIPQPFQAPKCSSANQN